MTRVYLADAKFDERLALRLMLLDLGMEVVGEAADWATTLAQAPATCMDMLLVEWELLPENLGVQALAELRLACPSAIVVVLISYLDARQQAALSAGADAFISKSETPDCVGERLRLAAAHSRLLKPSGWMGDLRSGALRLSRTPASGGEAFSAFSNDPKEDQTMNKDIFEGKWKQIRGEAKAWWGKLTDDDLDRVAGKFDVFTGLLQEKYGYTREAAANEIDKHVTAYEASLKTEPDPVK